MLTYKLCNYCTTSVVVLWSRDLDNAYRQPLSWSWGLRSCSWSRNHVLNQLFIIFQWFGVS